ncbi:hypothetical protein ACVWXO_001746 [Bradyrhizobium sp. LM2.7]
MPDASSSSLRAQRSNPDCLRGKILDCFAALAMTTETAKRYLTTPDVNPAFRRGGLISFFRKQRASRPV